VKAMAVLPAGTRVDPAMLLRQHKLPSPPGRCLMAGSRSDRRGPNDLAEIPDLLAEDAPVKKGQRTQGLILDRRADFPFDCKMRRVGVDLRFGHFGGVPEIMKINAPPGPQSADLLVTAGYSDANATPLAAGRIAWVSNAHQGRIQCAELDLDLSYPVYLKLSPFRRTQQISHYNYRDDLPTPGTLPKSKSQQQLS
jgi:hypothetical protein